MRWRSVSAIDPPSIRYHKWSVKSPVRAKQTPSSSSASAAASKADVSHSNTSASTSKASRADVLGAPTFASPAGEWPPFIASDPYRTIRRSGLKVHFPVSPTPEPPFLADTTEQQQRQAINLALARNRGPQNNHSPNLPSPAPTGAIPLSYLLPTIPTGLAEVPRINEYAIQPLAATPLNVSIGRGDVRFLTYYFYYIEVFAANRDQAEKCFQWMAAGEHDDLAAIVGQSVMFRRWKKGVERFVDLGAWDGECASLLRYTGEGDGADHVPSDGRITLRAFDHFKSPDSRGHLSLHAFLLILMGRYIESHDDHGLDIAVHFVSTAADLDNTLSLERVKLLEALICSWRWTDVDHGGANVASCGRLNHLAERTRALSSLPALMTLADLDPVVAPGLVSAGVFNLLMIRYPLSTTVFDVLTGVAEQKYGATAVEEDEGEDDQKEAGSASDEEDEQETDKKGKGKAKDNMDEEKVRRQPALSSPRFNSDPTWRRAPDPSSTPSPSTVAQLRARHPPIAVANLTPEVSAWAQPFQHAAFFPELCKLGSTAQSILPGVLTRDTVRAGVDAELTGSADTTYKKLTLALADGGDVVRVRLQVRSSAIAGTVRLRWSDVSKQITMSRAGEPLQVFGVAYGGGRKGKHREAVDWEWDADEFESRVKVDKQISLKPRMTEQQKQQAAAWARKQALAQQLARQILA